MMRILAAPAAIGLAAAALFWSASAQALGLGEVEVRSHLNERFSATIPLVSASADDLDSLVISVASPEEFARSGVERADIVSNLSFARAGNGIRVSSREAVRDPFLTFIVEARWNGGRLLREYTVLLDPPGSKPGSAPAASPPTVAIAAGPSPLPLPLPAPAPVPVATGVDASGRYGPVPPGQTLWSIARSLLRDPGVSHEQMVLALYAGNPQAFVGGDIDHLLKGSVLKVPTAAEAKAVDVITARTRVAELRDGAQAAPADATPVVAAAPTPVLVPAPAPVPEAAVAATPPPEATTVDSAAVVGEVPPAAELPPSEIPPAELPAEVAPAAETAPAAAVEAEPQIEERPAPVEVPVEDASTSWGLLGGLLLLIVALIAVKLRGRKEPAPPVARRAGNVVEPLATGADALMDRPRTRPLPSDDDAPTVLKPLAPASDAEPEPTPALDETEAAVDAKSLGLGLGLGGVDAGDPMTEADFHLAYGLYDEAAQMLKTAIAADPERSELKVKLAEVWSAAGNAAEFRILAESMAGQVSVPEWQKVSAMGRAILPDLALFRNDGVAVAPTIAISTPTAPLADALRDLSVIDFDLDADVPRRDAPAASAPAAAAPSPAPIDPLHAALMEPLEDAPLPPMVEPVVVPAAEVIVVPTPPPPVVAPVPPPSPSTTIDLMTDLDLSSFDLDDEVPVKAADPGRVEFTMADLDAVADEPLVLEPESEVIGGDEIDTKLDLARAYADMGDAEAARGLLDEVLAGGNDRQQQDARALRQRLTD
jgi:pilus assembly protein FimV